MSTQIQIAPKSASGIFGISDSAGVYTYYATLTLAMAAATSGQTIEMFTSVIETGAVTVTLKEGVTINGNGHTYSVTNAGISDVFETTIAGIYRVYNLNVIRTNATGICYVLNAKNFVASTHYLDGTHFTTNKGGIFSGSANFIQRFYNGAITISGTSFGIAGVQDNELNYGWDIDHIVPLSSATSVDELYKLNHYKNLQPMCSYTNRYIKKDNTDYNI